MRIARHGVRVAWLCLAIACQERNPAFVGATTESTGETSDPSTTATTASTSTASTTTASTSTASTDASESESESESDPQTTTDPGESSSSSDTGIDPACLEDLPPVGGECPAECTGGCAVPGECAIDCSGGCGAEVVCPEGFACTIACMYGNCQNTTLRCASEHACRISCAGSNTCRNATFVCGAGSCAVECNAGGNICRDATLQCGTADSRACGDSSSVTPVPADGSTCPCVNDC